MILGIFVKILKVLWDFQDFLKILGIFNFFFGLVSMSGDSFAVRFQVFCEISLGFLEIFKGFLGFFQNVEDFKDIFLIFKIFDTGYYGTPINQSECRILQSHIILL